MRFYAILSHILEKENRQKTMSKQKRLTKEAFSEIYLEHYDDMKRFAAKRFFAAGRTDPH